MARMASRAVWRSRPIFITSTFRDMHAERGYLQDYVFPELAERLRDRHHHLEAIDLRWGVDTVSVDEEHAKELLVLKVCLSEIERSRPFLIVLLGDRYGWVPPAERMRAAATEAGFTGDITGKSITALEIEYGILSRLAERHRCRIYLRDPLPYDQMPPEIAARYSDNHLRLPSGPGGPRIERLKERLAREMASRVRHYSARWDSTQGKVTGLERWGRQVLDDLWEDLEAETGEFSCGPSATWQQEEAFALEQFAETQCRDFIGRKDLLRELLSHACLPGPFETNWGVCIAGSSGSGKSALFVELYRQLRSQSGILLLAHSAGVSTRSAHIDSLLRRWCAELAQQLGVSDPCVSLTAHLEVEAAFDRLLSTAAANRRVVCLIDALNQFEPTPSPRHLEWLPRAWPANARLIVTTLPGAQTESLANRPGVRIVPLPPLTVAESGDIAAAVCRRYHKALHPEILAVLASKERAADTPASGIPLWLELALEHLLLLDEDDFERAEREFTGTADQKLHALLLDTAQRVPAAVEDLYEYLLAREERVYGERLARAFASLIAASRSGWRELDLRMLLPLESGEPWDTLRFAALRRGFRAHLAQRGAFAQWDFAHGQMRQAVLRRNLADAALSAHTHEVIGNYLESLAGDDPLRQAELMFHLLRTGDRLRVARYYASPIRGNERANATRDVAAYAANGITENLGVCSWLNLAEIDAPQRAFIASQFTSDLALAMQACGGLPAQLHIQRAAERALVHLTASDPSNSQWQRSLATNRIHLGDLLMARGDSASAVESYRAAIAAAEHAAAADPQDSAVLGDLIMSLSNVGNVYKLRGEFDAALQAYRQSLALAERVGKTEFDKLVFKDYSSVNHVRIGDLLMERGDMAGALRSFRSALAIREELAITPVWGHEKILRDILVCQGKIANALRKSGDPQGAIVELNAALKNVRLLMERDPERLDWRREEAVLCGVVSDVLLTQGDTAGAYNYSLKALSVCKMLVRADRARTGWQDDLWRAYKKAGLIAVKLGKQDVAAGALQEAIDITKRLSGTDRSHSIWTEALSDNYDALAGVLEDAGDTAGAIAAYRHRTSALEELAQRQPGDPGHQRDLVWTHNRLGSLFRTKGDLPWSVHAYRAGVTVSETLIRVQPGDAGLQRDLAVSFVKIGDMLRQTGDYNGSWDAYTQARVTLQRMKAQGLPLDKTSTYLMERLRDLPEK